MLARKDWCIHMKKPISVCLMVLLLCFVSQITYGASPPDIVWGPENQGLRMNLHIENADSNQPDVYKVGIRLANVGPTPVVLVAQWYYDEEKGDYREFLKQGVELTSFPEVKVESAQTAGNIRTSPQPTLEIKPGDSVAVEWVTAPRHLKPKGYYNTTPAEFPSDGLYSIRAKFLANSKQDSRILLYSNDCRLSVGKSTAMPKFAMARIIQADPAKETVVLALGSDQKIEPNDRFECGIFPYVYWDILITEVKHNSSTGSVKISSREPRENVPTFPEVGSVATLLPAGHRHGCQLVPNTASLQGDSNATSSETLIYEAKLEEVKKKAERITIGMKRAEVEQLFRVKDGGVEGPSISRYYEHPEVMINIPFDQTGGNWSPDNRVTGEPNIYRSLRHLD